MTDAFGKSKWINLPRNVVVGHDVLEEVPDVLETRLGFERALVVTSPTTRDVAGDEVATHIKDDGLAVETVVVEKAGFGAVEHTTSVAEEFDADVLLGVGGGVPIDTAKVSADEVGAPYVSDYIYDETVTLTLKRAGSFAAARRRVPRCPTETDATRSKRAPLSASSPTRASLPTHPFGSLRADAPT